jgi:hypothetical protein
VHDPEENGEREHQVRRRRDRTQRSLARRSALRDVVHASSA